MTQETRLAAALAVGVGLTAAGAALAQAQTGSAPPPAPATQPAPAQSAPPPIQTVDPGANRPIYSADPPPNGSSGLYLPAVIFGYARSATACVVIGCDDGPRIGASDPSSSAATQPLPVGPGSYTPH